MRKNLADEIKEDIRDITFLEKIHKKLHEKKINKLSNYNFKDYLK